MKSISSPKVRAALCAAIALLFGITFLYAQQTAQQDASIQTTTQERVESEPWWPTKSTFPLQAFAGSKSCVKCHADESAPRATAMQQAASPAAESKFLIANPHKTAAFASFAWTLSGQDFTVAHGAQTFTQPIAWDMGAGDLAHTFLYQHDGHWFQSQVTYYTKAQALDTTTGFNTLGEADIETALGQKLTGEEARKCFACHTVHATTSAGFNPAHAEPGLGCEACHGPGREHVEKMDAALANPKASAATLSRPTNVLQDTIFNPAGLSPVDAIDFCGSCHRTSVDATLAAGPNSLGTAAVRFQPYRLQQSKCWRATQSDKLTCTACHNPHEPLERAPVAYDKTCLSCHTKVHETSAGTHASRIATAGQSTSCVSCHMPRVEVSSMHGAFTDHRIRIPHANQAFPD